MLVNILLILFFFLRYTKESKVSGRKEALRNVSNFNNMRFSSIIMVIMIYAIMPSQYCAVIYCIAGNFGGPCNF